ncbi:HD domain-containing phosphohydrolase [Maridesulfovibrio frigidus]|uniref:HD domain-containing phosphohydrolase n=1 Tax=Maridesulfovibrio frigidus TaxID=340956 RepID=UPI0004E27E10|nr:HD domain-containing phosphohydrolase [Maridesulfovibrio frigidus]
MNKNLFVVSENMNIISSIVKLCSPICNVVASSIDLVNLLILSSNTPPSVIIIECNNYLDVREVLEKIKEKFGDIKRVLIISFLEDKLRREINDKGLANKIIVKPCSKASLLSLLKGGTCHDKTSVPISKHLIGGIIEGYGAKIPVVFRAFDRICTNIDLIEKYIHIDTSFAKDVLAYYILAITNLSSELIQDMLCGSQSKKDSYALLHEQLTKIKDVTLSNDPNCDPLPLKIMMYTNKRYNGKGFPKDDVAGEFLPYLSRIFKVLFDFHYLIEKGKSTGEAVFILSRRNGWYDNEILQGLISSQGEEATFYLREVFPLGLQSEMIMAQDLYVTVKGKNLLLIKTGQILSDKNIDYIHMHAQNILDVTEPILIKESVVLGEDSYA